MPCPSTLRSAPLCLCETTPFHAFALLRSSFHAFALLIFALPSPDLPCATSPWLYSALLFHAFATLIVSPLCLCLAHRVTTVPLPCSSTLNHAIASPRPASPLRVLCHNISIHSKLIWNFMPHCKNSIVKFCYLVLHRIYSMHKRFFPCVECAITVR